MPCTLALSKNDFSPSNDKSKLSYTLKGLLSHFEMNALFLSSLKRSSNSTKIVTKVMIEKLVESVELMVIQRTMSNKP